MRQSIRVLVLICIMFLTAAALYMVFAQAGRVGPVVIPGDTGPDDDAAMEVTIAGTILRTAREEVKNRVVYDASYVAISYPGGDVPADRGSCTDVIIRALRSVGADLQQLMHEDMKENFHLYPKHYGLTAPDRNIDHRRVANQMRFLERFGKTLTKSVDGQEDQWLPGDIVYWRFTNGQLHAGIISDRQNRAGIPLAIHNAGVAREEDCLLRWEIIGHFRYPEN